ncbi:DUF305 domain-containing protein [Plantibacter sp. CFBP 8804]|uniref:DUF305 domain-containing protein n=1 Tax=Plantibacter sp. CFBP 8804 TaxID=2775270 RepID=UPI001FCED02A|nr:DUF305 domain-containing protein [Plantibacter sp. CFBP 8804]
MTPASTSDAPATGEPADGGVTDEELAAWEAQGSPDGSSRTRVVIAAMAVVAIMVAAAIGFSVGRLSTLADPTPTTTSAEAGFSRDMQVHHNQGVELAMIIRDRTDAVDVRTLAYDIATTQAQQSGQLYDWLVQWNLPQGSRQPDMTWMTLPTLTGASGHAHGGDTATPGSTHTPGDPMPGLATPAQIDQLTAASGLQAERVFLTLMIAHHQGAVEMAEALQPRTTNATALAFTRAVIASQQAEIELMTRMLDDRGGPVDLAG